MEGFLWIASLTSCLAVLLLVEGGSAAAVELMRLQGLLWWAWLLAFYLTLAIVVSLIVTALATLLRRVGVGRVAVRVMAAVIVSIVVVLNGTSVIRILSGSAAGGSHGLAVAALVAAIAALGVMATRIPSSRPLGFRALAALSMVGCFIALRGPVAESTDSDERLARAQASSQERLLVIGLDGADWDFVTPLIDRGELPHLRSLRERGVWGELQTLRPSRSAPIWTSVVTGVTPQRHSIVNNSVERLRGSFHRLPNILPAPRGMAIDRLEALLRSRRLIAPSTVASFDRRVPAIWNIATANGSQIDVVNWWASWPVEQIHGHIVSDRTHFWRSQAKGFSADRGFVTYPDSLLAELAPLILRPDQVTYEHALEFMQITAEEFERMKSTPYRHHRLSSEFKYLYSMFVSNLRIALGLMERGRHESGRPADQFVLLRIIDQASHQALEYSELVDNHLGSTPEEIERYAGVVTEAYRAADRAVGRLVEAFGPGNVIVLSDHGFKLQRPRSANATYGHAGASPPDGIFIAAGPALGQGPVSELGIYDMMPFFLALKGWPVATDFVREVPSGLFRQGFFEDNPIEVIDSYGTMSVRLPAEGPIVADEEMVERLRALGYLD